MTINNQKGKRILLVEDNKKIMHGNQRLFGMAGYKLSLHSHWPKLEPLLIYKNRTLLF